MSSINTYYYDLAFYLIDIHCPIFKISTNQYTIKDSFSFADWIKQDTEYDGGLMCSFDIKSLFMNVPLNFGQHRRPTYSNNNGSKMRQNWWARFTISSANDNHNTKGHCVIKTKDLNKNWLATWHFHQEYTKVTTFLRMKGKEVKTKVTPLLARLFETKDLSNIPAIK